MAYTLYYVSYPDSVNFFRDARDGDYQGIGRTTYQDYTKLVSAWVWGGVRIFSCVYEIQSSSVSCVTPGYRSIPFLGRRGRGCTDRRSNRRKLRVLREIYMAVGGGSCASSKWGIAYGTIRKLGCAGLCCVFRGYSGYCGSVRDGAGIGGAPCNFRSVWMCTGMRGDVRTCGSCAGRGGFVRVGAGARGVLRNGVGSPGTGRGCAGTRGNAWGCDGALWDAQEWSGVGGDVRECVGMFGDVWEWAGIFGDVRESAGMRRNMWGCAGICGRVRECMGTFGNLRGCSRMCGNVRGFSGTGGIRGNVTDCAGPYGIVRDCAGMCGNFRGSSGMCGNFRECARTRGNLRGFSGLFGDVRGRAGMCGNSGNIFTAQIHTTHVHYAPFRPIRR